MDESYIVVAYRYGTNENVFPVGVFSSRKLAVDAATNHNDYRGGKYKYKIYKVYLDVGGCNSNPQEFIKISGLFGE